MDRIPELRYSLFAARNALRERFASLPARPGQRTYFDADQPPPNDIDMLRLLTDTTISRNCDESKAPAEYRRVHASASASSGLPDYEEALARGWFRVVHGEVTRAVTLLDHCYRGRPSYDEDLRGFVSWLWHIEYQVDNPGTHGSASAFESLLLCDATPEQLPPVRSPGWVAARLWEQDSAFDLAVWETQWEILGFPMIVPTNVWSTEHAQSFREAALDALRNGNLAGWEEIQTAHGILEFGDARQASDVEVPRDLLGRYLTRLHGGDLFSAHRLCAFARLLLLELPHIGEGKPPSTVAQELVALAMQHPELLDVMAGACLESPEVLADLILCPSVVAWVCYVVATWEPQNVAHRDSRHDMFDAVRKSLFEDCLGVFAHHLASDAVGAEEYGRLLTALQEHDLGSPGAESLLPIALAHLQRFAKSKQAEILQGVVAVGAHDAKSSGYLVLLKVLSATGAELKQDDATKVAEAYRIAVASMDGMSSLLSLDAPCAGALARVAFPHVELHASVLSPLEVGAALAATENNSVKVGQALRAHIRFLSRAILGYPEAGWHELAQALADAVCAGAVDSPNTNQVDAFTFHLDAMRRGRLLRLEIELADAIGHIDTAVQQKKVVDAALLVRDPLVLAVLLRRAPVLHQERIRAQLETLTPMAASAPVQTFQLEERVQAFLDAGLPQLAEMYMMQRHSLLRNPTSPDAQVETLRHQLQLRYLRREWPAISEAKLPKDWPKDRAAQGGQILDFFRALALIEQRPEDASMAAAIFKRLYTQTGDWVYAINRLSAECKKLLGSNEFRTLSGPEAAEARQALQDADKAIPPGSQLSERARAVHVPNCAVILLATGRAPEALRRLHELGASARTADSMAYEAVACHRLNDHDRALSLIRLGKDRFGETPLLLGAESHIVHSSPHPAASRLLKQTEVNGKIREALTLFAKLPPGGKAAVMREGVAPLEELLLDAFRDAVAAFERAMSFLHLTKNSFHEDDFNGLFAEIVQGRIEGLFGWQANEQSPGGLTPAGNAGRRDFVLRQNGVDIAVFEALKASRPNDPVIDEHFVKLVGYSQATIFFHVTYSFRDAPASEMLNAIEKVAQQSFANIVLAAPPERIAADTARPAGIHGRYRRSGEDISVFFFVVDMLQANLRQVGKPPKPPKATGRPGNTMPTKAGS